MFAGSYQLKGPHRKDVFQLCIITMQGRFLQLQDFLGFCSVNYPHLILQTDPVFIGVSRREMNVRPTAFFFTKCSIDSSGVTELYSRAQDGYESTKLFAVSAVSSL